MVPLDVSRQIRGPVEFTDDVPADVRALFADVPAGDPWFITTDPDAARAHATSTDADILKVPSLEDPVFQAVQVMHAARTRGEWERSMTHTSLIPFLKEETQELAEAIEQHASDQHLKKELSDVLLQVLFHAEIAQERGAFDFGDVAQAFVQKMQSRAPYLFDGSTGLVDVATQDRLWAEGKARER